MISQGKTCLLLLSLAASLAASESDTVNERIPVSQAELEAHWHVDCAKVSDFLARAVSGSMAGEACGLRPELRRRLQLCTFIYQAPGSNSDHICPDYRGALEVLERAGPADDCAAFEILLHTLEDCAAQ
jgi:hypothetical protein